MSVAGLYIPVDFEIELGVPCQLYWFIPVDTLSVTLVYIPVDFDRCTLSVILVYTC